MKYLKLFETRTSELKKFCNDNLAYLIDDDFNFSVKVSRRAQLQSDSNFVVSIKYIQDRYTDTIFVEKFSKRNTVSSEIFNFSDYSDDLITFILFVNEKYGIKSIMYINQGRKGIDIKGIDNIHLLENTRVKRLVITINK